MATSDPPDSKGNRGVLVLRLAGILVLFAALYAGAWFLAARLAEREVGAALASVSRSGRALDCPSFTVSGFPWKFGGACSKVTYRDPKAALAITTGPARSWIRLYDPLEANVRIAAPVTVASAKAGTFVLNWSDIKLRLALSLRQLAGVTVETQDLEVRQARPAASDPKLLLTAEATSGEAKTAGRDLAFVGTFEGLRFGDAVPQLKGLPPLTGDGNLALSDGAVVLAGQPLSLRNRTVEVKRLAVAPGSDTDMRLSGTVTFDGKGLADGTLQLTIRNPKALAPILGSALPQFSSQIGTAMGMLASLGDEPRVPLVLRKGDVILGLFKVGKLPPVQ